ncbi:HAD family hydrolase [Kineococcus rubinsiae]|uniref:HAD family hydrolase n=1 Tax=Kineococcus rubinsiae TaxID=2609562 RepID=UPI00143150BC|nr:HAD family phosphatase [Kineococcus rubinsiae]NIZ92722.1 HAD family phosphatase [Kineococcus rubinsiae]
MPTSAAPTASAPSGRPLPPAVLWDMDGTVVDTEPHWIAAETALLASHGATWTHEQALALVGSALPDSGRILSAHLQAQTGVVLSSEDIVEHLLQSVIAQLAAGVVWRPGALELLRSLGEAGVPCALVTMSYRSLADAVADLLPGVFRVVVAGDEVEHGKPAPDPYLLAASHLGLDPTACVAIEDSPTGVASAEAAGCHVIACPHMVPIPAAPGRTRVASLASVDLDVLAAIGAGEPVDEFADVTSTA